MLSVPDWDTRRKRKIADITQALSVSPVDVAALRRMAISEGGLLTDEIRCQVWPKLLNVPLDVLNQEPGIIIVDDMQLRVSPLFHLLIQRLAVNASYSNCWWQHFHFFRHCRPRK